MVKSNDNVKEDAVLCSSRARPCLMVGHSSKPRNKIEKVRQMLTNYRSRQMATVNLIPAIEKKEIASLHNESTAQSVPVL